MKIPHADMKQPDRYSEGALLQLNHCFQEVQNNIARST